MFDLRTIPILTGDVAVNFNKVTKDAFSECKKISKETIKKSIKNDMKETQINKLESAVKGEKKKEKGEFRIKFTEKDTEYFDRWFSFYPRRNKGVGFEFVVSSNGYFDPRPEVKTNLTSILALFLPFISLWLIPVSLALCFYSWGSIFIRLPYDSKRGNTSESRDYGITFYHVDGGFPSEFWVRGFPSLSFDFPWAYKFFKREVLMTYGWRKEEKGDDFWNKEKWKGEILTEMYDYTYTLKSGEVQKRVATVFQEKRYWRRWFNLVTKVRRTLEVEFSGEAGERSGSWKGVCIGCGYEMKEGETSLECLRRMEKERKF